MTHKAMPTRAAFIVQGSHMAGICAHCSSWAMARVFSCGWEGLGQGCAGLR